MKKKLLILFGLVFLTNFSIGCKVSSNNNKLIHTSTRYEDGTIKTEFYIRNNKIDSLYKEYYPTGMIKNKSIYKDGFVVSSLNFYNSGCLKSVFNYGNEFDGDITTYYDNCDGTNIIKTQGIFRDKKRDGLFYTFNKAGDTILIQEFRDDKMIKEFKK